MGDSGISEAERLRRQRRSVVWTAVLLALVAVAVYFGFIVLMGQR